MRTVTLLIAALTLVWAPLADQRIQPSPFASAGRHFDSRTDAARLTGTHLPDDVVNAGKMMGGGLLLGAGGLIGGALIGHQFEGSPCEDCILGAFFGALAGESLAIPLGVHLGNGRRGDVGPALAASIGIAAAGLGAAAMSRQWGVLLAIPVLQIAASIAIERHSAAGNP